MNDSTKEPLDHSGIGNEDTTTFTPSPFAARGVAESFSAARKIAEHAARQPQLLMEQFAALARSLTSEFSYPWHPFPGMQNSPVDSVGEHGPKVGEKPLAPVPGPNHYVGLQPNDLFFCASETIQKVANRPNLVLEQQALLARELMTVLSGTSLLGPLEGDKRFADSAWRENPFYRLQLQSYLASSNALHRLIENAGLDRTTYERMRYLVSLFNDALAPSNSLLSNPAALKRASETGGLSLVEGMRNMLTDISTNQGMPSQVDKSKFELGRNLAATPGAVVFSNPVLELIQYAAATEEVFARPQLVVPPNINKYYLVDLSPGRSLIEHLVSNGFQVFAVSWRNPTPAQREWGMDAYMAALMEAMDAVRDISDSQDVNLHIVCGASRIVAAMLGYLAEKDRRLVHAFSIICGVLLHDEESPLGPFSSQQSIETAKLKSAIKGVLDGDEMARAFTWARPNDLVWNYWVNNYLMGKSPPAFDILFWNDDRTRLPARLHAEMLDIFANSLFDKPGGIKAFGIPIDLARVDCDAFVVAGITDHLALWRNVYRSAQMYGGRFDFVLNSSGHIQTIVNPPGNPKAKYFSNSQTPADPDEWLAGAEPNAGSWWDHWVKWLAGHSGKRRSPPDGLGNDRFKPGIPAPGSYVREP